VLVGQAAAVLAGTLLRLEAQEGAGCISVPELRRFHSPRQAEELGSDRPVVNRCRVQAVEGSPIALVECPRPVPAQQANTWARAVLPALQRAGVERVLVVATLQVTPQPCSARPRLWAMRLHAALRWLPLGRAAARSACWCQPPRALTSCPCPLPLPRRWPTGERRTRKMVTCCTPSSPAQQQQQRRRRPARPRRCPPAARWTA
jgi:hypothetical protein